MIKTVKYIVTSALFRLGKETRGKEYTWLEQVAIDYLGEKAPLDGNVGLKCMYVDLGNSARVAQLPPDCMRISKIGVKSGNRVWTLTLDNNLSIPENLFTCDSEQDASEGFSAFFGGWGNGYWNNSVTSNYSLGGGRNINYYRIVNDNGKKLIVFDHNVGEGKAIVEYLSNGSDIGGDTMIDVTHAEPFRLYLMSQYVMFKGNREEKAMYKELQLQYECSIDAALLLVNAPRMAEMIDALAQASVPTNLG
jgi:hypothetical protein